MELYCIIAQWLAVACLLAWGVWLCRRLQVPAGFSPLLGIAFGATVLQLLGSVRLLLPGAALVLAGGAFLLYKGGRRALRACLPEPGILAFLAGVAAVQLFFALREPAFQTWDEFSHWGIFFKSVFYRGCLAQWPAGPDLTHQAYPQGLPALYALFRVLLPVYRERDVFLVTDLPLFAAAGAAFSVFVPKSRPAAIWHRLCAIGAAPLLFWLFAEDTPYTSVYMDAPVAALFSACLALLSVLPPAQARLRRGLAVGLAAAALTTIKEIGMVFALCVLGIWVLQCLAAQRPLCRAWQSMLAAAVPPAVSVAGWKLLLAVTHRTVDQFSDMDAGYFVRVVQEALDGSDPYLFTIRDRYITALNTFPLLFRHYNAVQLTIGCTVLSVLLAAALFRLRRGREGVQLAVIPLCMTVYWPCYCFVLFYVYICGMGAFEAEGMASFERYTLCFFIAWLAALLCAVWALWPGLPAKPLRTALPALQAGVLAAASLWGLRGGLDVFVLPVPAWRTEQQQNAAVLRELLPAGSGGTPLMVLDANDEEEQQHLLYYRYELYPQADTVIRPDIAQGTFAEWPDGQAPEYLLLFGSEPAFAARFAPAADDALLTAAQGYALYRVEPGSDGAEQLYLCTLP